MKEAVDKSNNKELKQDYNRLEKSLIENGRITDTVKPSIELDDTVLTYSNFQTLDDFLSTEIDSTVIQNDFEKNKNVLAASYNNNRNERQENFGYRKAPYDKRSVNTNTRYTRYTRPGLEDLE